MKVLISQSDYHSVIRSSHRRCLEKKCALKNFANFTRKHLQLCVKERIQQTPTKFFRTPFLKNICELLHLSNQFCFDFFRMNFEPVPHALLAHSSLAVLSV